MTNSPLHGRPRMRSVAEMDVRNLGLFFAVAECPTFSEAARRLGVTQASMSNQVTELEKRLGFKLFIPHRTSMRLTVAGMILFRGGKQLLATLDEIIDQAHAADAAQASKL